jgi:hypothetical protein
VSTLDSAKKWTQLTLSCTIVAGVLFENVKNIRRKSNIKNHASDDEQSGFDDLQAPVLAAPMVLERQIQSENPEVAFPKVQPAKHGL